MSTAEDDLVGRELDHHVDAASWNIPERQIPTIRDHLMRHERRALVIVLVWLAGAAWILIPHPGEGRVILVISTQFELGVHMTDPIGIIIPAIVTTALYWPETKNAVQRRASRSRAKLR